MRKKRRMKKPPHCFPCCWKLMWMQNPLTMKKIGTPACAKLIGRNQRNGTGTEKSRNQPFHGGSSKPSRVPKVWISSTAMMAAPRK